MSNGTTADRQPKSDSRRIYKEKTVQVGLSMPKSLKEKIDQLAGVQAGRSRSEVIVLMLAATMEGRIITNADELSVHGNYDEIASS